MIYALVGFMASGKSTVGKLLAKNIGAEFIDLDEFIVASQGRSIAEIFEAVGESGFREIEFNCLSALIEGAACSLAAEMVISLGGGTFIYEKSRELVLRRTKSIYLKTEFSDIAKRLSNDNGIRPLASNAEELFAIREPIYAEAAVTVLTSGKSPFDIVDLLTKLIYGR